MSVYLQIGFEGGNEFPHIRLIVLTIMHLYYQIWNLVISNLIQHQSKKDFSKLDISVLIFQKCCMGDILMNMISCLRLFNNELVKCIRIICIHLILQIIQITVMSLREKKHLPSKQKKRKQPSLNQEQMQEIKQAFDLFDMEKTQTIKYHELKMLLRALGFDVNKAAIAELAYQHDKRDTGTITYSTYVQIMKQKYSQRDPLQEAIKAFKLIDLEGKGKISLRDLKVLAKDLGENLSSEQLTAMIDCFDHDGDGQISQEQFLNIVNLNNI